MGASRSPSRLLEWRAVSTRCLFGNCRTNAAIFLIAYVCASQCDNEPTTRAQAAAVGDSEKVGASEQA